MKILPINTLMFRASQPLKPIREEDKARIVDPLKPTPLSVNDEFIKEKTESQKRLEQEQKEKEKEIAFKKLISEPGKFNKENK